MKRFLFLAFLLLAPSPAGADDNSSPPKEAPSKKSKKKQRKPVVKKAAVPKAEDVFGDAADGDGTDNAPTTTAPKRRTTKKAAIRRPRTPRQLLNSLPKGWRITQKGLPAGVTAMATGPRGEVFVVSKLDRGPENFGAEDAKRWLLDQLPVRNGTVESGGAFGSFELRGALEGSSARAPRAVRAWVVPGKPVWLVSWIGPSGRAAIAEKQVRLAAERWTKG